MSGSTMLVAQSLSTFISIYTTILIIRILLTWFPSVNWYSQPFAALSQITDPYLDIFRRVIPPLGGFDFSPILAIFLLQFLGRFLESAAYAAF
ncbi:YggT family protein [Thermoleptolyngbya sichuanensis A183]|uniref:YggT family protein n=1 Tax=Thermoleptolyngbya sichuanensis A183 TaxID=2737172 RepID=A0A6M8BJX6_9CYAN|nr:MULTISPECIES: YggT family protein [Thermoleptolyngbya]QKD84520.1 YggT family protein [Thermoleptolyngbya sichuanensis A183]